MRKTNIQNYLGEKLAAYSDNFLQSLNPVTIYTNATEYPHITKITDTHIVIGSLYIKKDSIGEATSGEFFGELDMKHYLGDHWHLSFAMKLENYLNLPQQENGLSLTTAEEHIKAVLSALFPFYLNLKTALLAEFSIDETIFLDNLQEDPTLSELFDTPSNFLPVQPIPNCCYFLGSSPSDKKTNPFSHSHANQALRAIIPLVYIDIMIDLYQQSYQFKDDFFKDLTLDDLRAIKSRLIEEYNQANMLKTSNEHCPPPPPNQFKGLLHKINNIPSVKLVKQLMLHVKQITSFTKRSLISITQTQPIKKTPQLEIVPWVSKPATHRSPNTPKHNECKQPKPISNRIIQDCKHAYNELRRRRYQLYLILYRYCIEKRKIINTQTLSLMFVGLLALLLLIFAKASSESYKQLGYFCLQFVLQHATTTMTLLALSAFLTSIVIKIQNHKPGAHLGNDTIALMIISMNDWLRSAYVLTSTIGKTTLNIIYLPAELIKSTLHKNGINHSTIHLIPNVAIEVMLAISLTPLSVARIMAAMTAFSLAVRLPYFVSDMSYLFSYKSKQLALSIARPISSKVSSLFTPQSKTGI